MGYFSFGAINFIYKIYRSKKFRKFIIGFGFLAFVLCTIIGNTTFAAQSDAEYTTDTTIAILENYQRNVDIFVHSFKTFYDNDTYKSRFNTFFQYLRNGRYIYLRHYSVGNNDLNCLLYSKDNVTTTAVDTNYRVDGTTNDSFLVPTTGYNVSFTYNANVNVTNFGFSAITAVSVSDFIPSVLLYRTPKEIVECMEQAGYYYSGPIVDIKDMIADMKDTQEDIYNTINEEPDEDKANTDLQNMIPDTTTDITSGGFNTIFDTIRNEFINPTNNSVEITVPFTNKSFTISRNNIYGGLYNNIRNSVIGQLITSFWWFSLGYFIYMDIAHIINKVKSGNIEDIENTNIKEDLL